MAVEVDEHVRSHANGASAASAAGDDAARRPRSSRHRYGWVVEALAIVVGYEIFEFVRDHVMGPTSAALRHAERLVDIEKAVGLYHEHGIQHAFLGWPRFMAFWNLYYGSIHFVAPLVALLVLYRKAPARYLRWRNTLIVMELVALAGFILLPMMPPRLMPSQFGFVDAAARFFNLGPQVHVTFGPNGTPDPGAIKSFGNLYAAMPSLHVGWAAWSALALLPMVRRWWAKGLLLLYPFVTLFAVVVTGNHWILDGAGGWAVLAIAWSAVAGFERIRVARPAPDLAPAQSAP